MIGFGEGCLLDNICLLSLTRMELKFGWQPTFDVYLGNELDSCLHINGLSYDVVTKLIRFFVNRNHHSFFDNFF